MKHAVCFRATGLAVIASSFSLALVGQTGKPTDLLLNALKEHFVTTVFSEDRTEVVAPGTVVALQKDGLLVYRVPADRYPISAYRPLERDIKFQYVGLSLGHSSSACIIDGVAQPGGCDGILKKTLNAGEKIWIDDIAIRAKEIAVIVATDPYNGGRYIGELWFPIEKGHLPTPDDAVSMISEVLVVQPAQDLPADQSNQPVPATNPSVGSGQLAPEPPPTPAMAPIAPPQPPADAALSAPPTISLGQTKDQVVAILGQPQKVANVGAKEIDFYPDMKVIFIKGRVTDIQ